MDKKFFLIPIFLIFLIFSFVKNRKISSKLVDNTEKRDEYMFSELQPLEDKLKNNEEINQEEVDIISEKIELRSDLYRLLKYYNKKDLFPDEYYNEESCAQSVLAFWLLHGNELGYVPKEIKFVTKVKIDYKEMEMFYYVFKFIDDKLENPDEWLVGVSGPFLLNQKPYSKYYSGTLSTFLPFESKTPEKHVDQVHKLMIKNNAYKYYEK